MLLLALLISARVADCRPMMRKNNAQNTARMYDKKSVDAKSEVSINSHLTQKFGNNAYDGSSSSGSYSDTDSQRSGWEGYVDDDVDSLYSENEGRPFYKITDSDIDSDEDIDEEDEFNDKKLLEISHGYQELFYRKKTDISDEVIQQSASDIPFLKWESQADIQNGLRAEARGDLYLSSKLSPRSKYLKEKKAAVPNIFKDLYRWSDKFVKNTLIAGETNINAIRESAGLENGPVKFPPAAADYLDSLCFVNEGALAIEGKIKLRQVFVTKHNYPKGFGISKIRPRTSISESRRSTLQKLTFLEPHVPVFTRAERNGVLPTQTLKELRDRRRAIMASKYVVAPTIRRVLPRPVGFKQSYLPPFIPVSKIEPKPKCPSRYSDGGGERENNGKVFFT